MWLRPRGPDALGRAVSACRRENGMTQQELARRLGVNRTTVIALEAGRNQSLARAVDALNLLGYDLAVVPKAAKLTVTEPEAPVREEVEPPEPEGLEPEELEP